MLDDLFTLEKYLLPIKIETGWFTRIKPSETDEGISSNGFLSCEIRILKFCSYDEDHDTYEKYRFYSKIYSNNPLDKQIYIIGEEDVYENIEYTTYMFLTFLGLDNDKCPSVEQLKEFFGENFIIIH